uniref:Uncharacterized protein n=1 Tax=Rhizophora mucronata TaxID=61149 RepID=A0A2P2IHB5_RHIMU
MTTCKHVNNPACIWEVICCREAAKNYISFVKKLQMTMTGGGIYERGTYRRVSHSLLRMVCCCKEGHEFSTHQLLLQWRKRQLRVPSRVEGTCPGHISFG